jgi:outer membrane immunogenic protein
MRKNVLVISVLSTLLVASVVYASPMTEMKQGTGKIDASFSLGPSFKAEEYGWTSDMDGKTRGRLGITYALGDKFGIDYKYVGHAGDFLDSSLQSNQLNLIYQFNPNVEAFAGYVHSRLKIPEGNIENSQNGYQVGVLGRMDIAKRTSAWASVGVGNKITAYEIGVGYDLTHDFDLNLFYNDTKYRGFDYGIDAMTHSVNLGITYHF